MRVVEAGCDALSTQVDAARARAGEREHLSVRADGENAAAGDGKCFDLRITLTHGQNPAVVQKRIRAGVPTSEGGGARRDCSGDEGAAADASSHGFSSPLAANYCVMAHSDTNFRLLSTFAETSWWQGWGGCEKRQAKTCTYAAGRRRLDPRFVARFHHPRVARSNDPVRGERRGRVRALDALPSRRSALARPLS